ncbi:TIGR04104 family putative zinc finger protein [Alkalihalobacillus sp. R86527]|uniref:TIGR04104 family putative zinc finger protein n=1 Tax=Alkalihalobacillus sp. R86527 TaxID=3093863 RepID=UPI00366F5372
MPQCDVCQNKFSWKTVQKAMFFAYRPITCKKCGTVNQVTFISRILVAILSVVPIGLLGMFVNATSTISFSSTIALMAAYSVGMYLCLPYIVNYQSTNATTG